MLSSMSLAIVYSRAQIEIDAPEVRVEVHLSGGLPRIFMVGLAEAAVKESRDRVRSALLNSGFTFPVSRVTISLAPADLPKDGSRFDLAIAMGILAASAQVPKQLLDSFEFVGELSLGGELRPVNGILPTALAATRRGRKLIIPEANQDEAGLLRSDDIFYASSLLNVVASLLGRETLAVAKLPARQKPDPLNNLPDLKNVCGQQHAIRALTVAAAGKHNLLFSGPPGSGKTLLASCMPGILPQLTETEALETMAIRSVAGMPFNVDRFKQAPYRNPHNTASAIAMVGGGSKPRPGEISLAHRGVLFLDEIPEFPRSVLEVLREPLESGQIVISRAARQSVYPAQFQLLAAMNPCPCGFSGDRSNNCHCSREQIIRYRQRISGPLLDRIDMQVEVPRLALTKIKDPQEYTSDSRIVRNQVSSSRELQRRRQGVVNAQLSQQQLQEVCRLSPADQDFLIQTCEQLHLSARAYTRILKLARTIADMEAEVTIQPHHLAEAIGYRRGFNQSTA